MKLDAYFLARIGLASLGLSLAACTSAPLVGEPSKAAGASPLSYRPEYAVGGRVRGLEGVGLTLRGLHGEVVKIDDDGRFAFGTRLLDGSSYNVTVAQEPISPVQSCVVERGAGRIIGRNALEITVECTTSRFDVPAPAAERTEEKHASR